VRLLLIYVKPRDRWLPAGLWACDIHAIEVEGGVGVQTRLAATGHTDPDQFLRNFCNIGNALSGFSDAHYDYKCSL
jgi:hypothetical protein